MILFSIYYRDLSHGLLGFNYFSMKIQNFFGGFVPGYLMEPVLLRYKWPYLFPSFLHPTIQYIIY